MLSLKVPVANHDPAFDAVAVTPHDTNTIKADGTPTRSVWVGTGGDLAVVMASGSAVTYPNVPSGTELHICCTIIKSTGTTASGIVGMF